MPQFEPEAPFTRSVMANMNSTKVKAKTMSKPNQQAIKSILTSVMEEMGKKIELDDDYNEDEKNQILKITEGDKKALKTPEWLRDRRFGYNQKLAEDRAIIQKKISEL